MDIQGERLIIVYNVKNYDSYIRIDVGIVLAY